MKELDIDKIKSDLQSRFNDFAEKIAPVYEILNWQWVSGVPKKHDIIECLNDLLNDVKVVDISQDYPKSRVCTGGLWVGYEIHKHEGMIISIELILKFEVNGSDFDAAIKYMKEKV